jgi:hypothetical protein
MQSVAPRACFIHNAAVDNPNGFVTCSAVLEETDKRVTQAYDLVEWALPAVTHKGYSVFFPYICDTKGFMGIRQATLDESIDVLLGLLDFNMEQIRICQIVNALLTSSMLVRGEALAKTTTLCFRLYSSKVRCSVTGNAGDMGHDACARSRDTRWSPWIRTQRLRRGRLQRFSSELAPKPACHDHNVEYCNVNSIGATCRTFRKTHHVIYLNRICYEMGPGRLKTAMCPAHRTR